MSVDLCSYGLGPGKAEGLVSDWEDRSADIELVSEVEMEYGLCLTASSWAAMEAILAISCPS